MEKKESSSEPWQLRAKETSQSRHRQRGGGRHVLTSPQSHGFWGRDRRRGQGGARKGDSARRRAGQVGFQGGSLRKERGDNEISKDGFEGISKTAQRFPGRAGKKRQREGRPENAEWWSRRVEVHTGDSLGAAGSEEKREKRRRSVAAARTGFQPVAAGQPAGGFEGSGLIRLLRHSSQRMVAASPVT